MKNLKESTMRPNIFVKSRHLKFLQLNDFTRYFKVVLFQFEDFFSWNRGGLKIQIRLQIGIWTNVEFYHRAISKISQVLTKEYHSMRGYIIKIKNGHYLKCDKFSNHKYVLRISLKKSLELCTTGSIGHEMAKLK